MSKEFIEFDEEQPAPETELTEPKVAKVSNEVEARLAKVEKAVFQIMKYLKELQKDAEEEAEVESEEEKAEEGDAEEMKEALESMKKEYEKLSKEVKELKDIPVRLTSPILEDLDGGLKKKQEEFLSKVSGAEILVWAEHRGVPWGQKRFGDTDNFSKYPVIRHR